jgi:hypothetical protein
VLAYTFAFIAFTEMPISSKRYQFFTLHCGQIYGVWQTVLLSTNRPVEITPYIRPQLNWLVFSLRYRLEETGISPIYGINIDSKDTNTFKRYQNISNDLPIQAPTFCLQICV